MPMSLPQFVATIQPWQYFLFMLAVFPANAILLRPMAMGRYDPLYAMNYLVSSFCLVNACYVYLIDNNMAAAQFWYILTAHAAFLSGAYVVRTVAGRRLAESRQEFVPPIARDTQFALNFLRIAAVVMFVGVLLRIVTVGLPILSANPDLSKVLINRDGFGFMSRILDPLAYCSLALACYLRRIGGMPLRKILLFFVMPLVALISSGSKSALLTVPIALYYASWYISSVRRERIQIVSFKAVVISLVVVMAFAVALLGVAAVGADAEDVGEYVTNVLIERFVAFGDGVFYYYTTNLPNLINRPASTFLNDYVVVPLLAPLRLVPYQMSLGVEMVDTLYRLEFLGPGPTMYVEGDVYFGNPGGILYCLCLGCLFSLLKFGTLRAGGRCTVPGLLLFCCCNVTALHIGQDLILVSGHVFNFGATVPLMLCLSASMLPAAVYGARARAGGLAAHRAPRTTGARGDESAVSQPQPVDRRRGGLGRPDAAGWRRRG